MKVKFFWQLDPLEDGPTMESTDFNATLLRISDQLSKEHLDKLRFLCKDIIRKKEAENIDTGFKLFTLLMERQKLADNDTDFLCEILENINRPDLAAKLQPFAEQCHGDNGKYWAV